MVLDIIQGFLTLIGNFVLSIIEFIMSIILLIITGYESQLLTLSAYTIIMVVYGIMIWHYYRTLAARNIIKTRPNPDGVEKIINLLIYFMVLPLITFIWFVALAFFLFLLAKTQSTETVLLTAITIVSAVRVSAYYNEDLSRDIAKMIPFALLGIFIIDPTFFSAELVVERVYESFSLVQLVSRYLIFTIVLEIVMRGFYGLIRWVSTKFRRDKSEHHKGFHEE